MDRPNARSTTNSSRPSPSSTRRPRRSRSNCGPRRVRCGRAVGSSSASGPSPSPRWPSRTSTSAPPTTRCSGVPRGITAPTAAGAAIFAVTVACALLAQYGERRFRNDETLDWQVAGWTAVVGGLLVIGLQIWQLTDLPFFPGVERLRLLLHRLGGNEHRRGSRRRPTGSRRSSPVSCASAERWRKTEGLRIRRFLWRVCLRANLNGCNYFWGFTAVVATFFWLLFYVV